MTNLQAKTVFKNLLSKLHLPRVKKHYTKRSDHKAKLEPSTGEAYCFTTNVFLAAVHNNILNIHLPPVFPRTAVQQNQRKTTQRNMWKYIISFILKKTSNHLQGSVSLKLIILTFALKSNEDCYSIKTSG